MKTRVMLPQPSNYHERTGRAAWNFLPQHLQWQWALPTADFGLLASSAGDRTLLLFQNTQCVVLCYGMPRRLTWSANILSKGKPPLCSLQKSESSTSLLPSPHFTLCSLPPTLLCAPSPQLCSVPISRWRPTSLGYINRPSCLLVPSGLANGGERRGAKVWLPPLPPHSPAVHMKVLAPAR